MFFLGFCQARFACHKFLVFSAKQFSSSVDFVELTSQSSTWILVQSTHVLTPKFLRAFSQVKHWCVCKPNINANQSEFLLFSCFQSSNTCFGFLAQVFARFIVSMLVQFIVFSFFNSLLIVGSQHGDKDLLIDLHQFLSSCHLVYRCQPAQVFMLLYFIVMLFDIISVYPSLLYFPLLL